MPDGPLTGPGGAVGDNAAGRLRSIVERIERLNEERASLGADIKDIFLEAKSAGFHVKALRRVIQLRRQDNDERQEQETLVALYSRELGL